MPTAPLIRLELVILDDPSNFHRFEPFLNVAQEDQFRILVQLANQDRLYLALMGCHRLHMSEMVRPVYVNDGHKRTKLEEMSVELDIESNLWYHSSAS